MEYTQSAYQVKLSSEEILARIATYEKINSEPSLYAITANDDGWRHIQLAFPEHKVEIFGNAPYPFGIKVYKVEQEEPIKLFYNKEDFELYMKSKCA